ncbi:hypothetical protein H9P43_002675 [Blastocladiella emersonii ATCC 22665]|nr:hypothetical protein H9P43_002675 [Blastocladiella emersonii ATCC 22665]
MTVETRQERTDRASREIGRLLLQGWCMLSESCPVRGCGCVLMQAPGQGRKMCVICGDASAAASAPAPAPVAAAAPAMPNGIAHADNADDASSDEDLERSLDEEIERQRRRLVAAHSAPAPASQSSVVAPTRLAGPEPSQLIGQRMLQGWTLLNETCPQCDAVPLVGKGNDKECVSCGPAVLAAAEPTPVVSSGSARAPTPAPAPAPAPAARAASPVRFPAAAPAPVARSVVHLAEPTPALGQLAAVVDRKIAQLTARLDAADHVADIQQYTQALAGLVALAKQV